MLVFMNVALMTGIAAGLLCGIYAARRRHHEAIVMAFMCGSSLAFAFVALVHLVSYGG